MRAGVALGSNLGDRLASLRNARNLIAALSGVRPPMRASAIYETGPPGFYMIGCFFHYNDATSMRTVLIVK